MADYISLIYFTLFDLLGSYQLVSKNRILVNSSNFVLFFIFSSVLKDAVTTNQIIAKTMNLGGLM